MTKTTLATGSIIPPASQTVRHWPLFWMLLLPAYLAVAAFETHWAFAAGKMLVPAVAGYFMIRKRQTVNGLVVAYLGFAVLTWVMVFATYNEKIRSGQHALQQGCLERNQNVAMMPEELRLPYCECMATEATPVVVWEAGKIFLTFKSTKVNPSEIPGIVSGMRKAQMICEAKLGG